MPQNLLELASKAKHGYQWCRQGRESWLKGTLELAKAVAEAKKVSVGSIAFNRWRKQAGLQSINKNDLAALVKIGNEIPKAKKWYEKNPDRWSWRHYGVTFAIPNGDSERKSGEPSQGSQRITVTPEMRQSIKEAGAKLPSSPKDREPQYDPKIHGVIHQETIAVSMAVNELQSAIKALETHPENIDDEDFDELIVLLTKALKLATAYKQRRHLKVVK
jgi:hypothetical protein